MKYITFYTVSVLLYIIKLNVLGICEFATENKYLGYFYTEQGSGNVQPYNWTHVKGPDECKTTCRKKKNCLTASLLSNNCSFYNTTNINIKKDNLQPYYKWLQCDWSSATQPPDGRCSGLSVLYFDKAITVDKNFLILEIINKESPLKCFNECLSHPFCTVINYKKSLKECFLYQLWPHNEVSEISQMGTNLYKWTCIPFFIESITVSKTPSQPNILKCTGFWKITTLNASLPNIYSPGVYFHTQSYNTCLLECNKYPTCKEVLFNVTVSLCILPFTESSDRNKYLEILTFIRFEWQCVKNNSIQPQMNKKEKYFVKIGLECVRLIYNSDVYIALEDCGKIPAPDKFVKCIPQISTKRWTVSDSCLVNQSFWKFPTKRHKLIINENVTTFLTKGFTGLTSFYYAHSKIIIFEKVNFVECRRFSGAKSLKVISESEIITRMQWYAYPPQGKFNIFDKTPKYIILTASQSPYYGCRTKYSCSDILRRLQMIYFSGSAKTEKYSDVPYNFMLDESGNIYEARGWKNQCAAVGDFNHKSLCFAFISWFGHKYPTLKFLKSVKRLIEFTVRNKYVEEDYILYIHQDATNAHINRKLAIIIKNWYRYRGYVPKDCSNISWIILLGNGLAIFFLTILFCTIFKEQNSKKSCEICNWLYPIKINLIYPRGTNTLEGTREYSLGGVRDTVYCVVTEKICIFQDAAYNTWKRLIKLWFFNRFLGSLCSLHDECDLASYLYSLKARHIKVYEAYSETCRERMEDKVHIVLYFSSESSKNIFESLICNKHCICKYFSVEFLSYSNLSFKIL